MSTFECYAARAGAALTGTEIDDLIRNITSNPFNAEILRRLKIDDPSLTCLRFLWNSTHPQLLNPQLRNDGNYYVEACSIGWLGYFIGESRYLKALHLSHLDSVWDGGHRDVSAFLDGMNRNRSVRQLTISLSYAGLQELTRFFAENKNLVKVVVERAWELDGGIAHRLSRAMKSCTSLKSFTFEFISSNEQFDGRVFEIIHSLSEKSQLEEVRFSRFSGRGGYEALADLLAWEGSQIQSLDIDNPTMDIEDFKSLFNAVASNKKLQKLSMHEFHGRDSYLADVDYPETLALIRAWGSIERVSLKAFVSNLVVLDITRENGSMDDEGVIAFSHALAGNRKLKVLKAGWVRLTSRGWNALSNLLCDTLSPKTTHASNHTLQELGLHEEEIEPSAVYVMFRNQIDPLLALNRNDNKSLVASEKILNTHDDFDMQVFFNWEFKMLPIVVQWLARAATSVLTNLPAEPNIQRRNLSVIYQFVRSAPKLFVESRLRGELEEIRAREKKIRGEQEMMPQERMPQELEWLEERRRVIINKLRGD